MRGRMREESLTEKISKPSYDIFNQKRVKGFKKKRKRESGGGKKGGRGEKRGKCQSPFISPP